MRFLPLRCRRVVGTKAASAVEYALLISGALIVSLGTIFALGNDIETVFSDSAASIAVAT